MSLRGFQTVYTLHSSLLTASATHQSCKSERIQAGCQGARVSLTSSMHLRASGQSQSNIARPHRASTQDCSSGHSLSTRTVSMLQALCPVVYPGPSWALLHSGVRPSSCSQTPKRVSSSSGIARASQSLTPACLSSHTGHTSSGHRVPLHSEVLTTLHTRFKVDEANPITCML